MNYFLICYYMKFKRDRVELRNLIFKQSVTQMLQGKELVHNCYILWLRTVNISIVPSIKQVPGSILCLMLWQRKSLKIKNLKWVPCGNGNVTYLTFAILWKWCASSTDVQLQKFTQTFLYIIGLVCICLYYISHQLSPYEVKCKNVWQPHCFYRLIYHLTCFY